MSAPSCLRIGAARGAVAPAGEIGALIELGAPGELPAAAAALGSGRVWVLGPGAEPLPGALEALLAAEEEIAVSLPVSAAGEPVEAELGRFADGGPEAMLAAVARRRIPLRHTGLVSLLAPADRVASLAAPDVERFGVHAGAEWSARLFASGPGVLIPGSRVQVPEPPRPRLSDALRAARQGFWGRGQTVREVTRALNR